MAPQKFQANELQSGGAGADRVDGGDPDDAKHAWQFMQGKLATMLWVDGIRLTAGGEDSNQSGGIIIPDGQPGAGSSVPGGPGVGTLTTTGNRKPKASKKPKSEPNAQNKADLYSKANDLLDKLSSSMDEEKAGAAGGGDAYATIQAERQRDGVLEGLMGDVDRLEGKLQAAKSDKTRQGYQRLVDAAVARLDEAFTKTAAVGGSDGAAVRGGSAGGAADPLPLD